jgi:hypothetical protein
MPTVQTIAPERSRSMAERLRIALLVWLAMLGLDFVLNGALFARMYQDGEPFFLAPIEAFRRIPLGYAAFLILAIGVVEIAYRLRLAGLAAGVRLGLALGAALAAIWSLSLFSIASLHAEVALAFAFTWLALVLMGSVVAAVGLARATLRGLALEVVAFDLVCVVTVVALQSSGVVPTQTT